MCVCVLFYLFFFLVAVVYFPSPIEAAAGNEGNAQFSNAQFNAMSNDDELQSEAALLKEIKKLRDNESVLRQENLQLRVSATSDRFCGAGLLQFRIWMARREDVLPVLQNLHHDGIPSERTYEFIFFSIIA